MKYLFSGWRFFLFCLALFCFFIHLTLIFWIKDQKKKQRIIKKYCQFVLWNLNIKLIFQGEPPEEKEKFLIVCNHCSYLDILILYSFLENPCFIVARDILETAFLGNIAKYADSYGVERNRRNQLKENISAIKNILLTGRNVVLFPEGSTGNGEKILKFKQPFFESAILAKKKVFPLCINYLLVDGEPLSRQNRDRVFWQGGRSIVKHFFRLCQIQKIECEITFTTPLPSNNTNRFELSLKSYNNISTVFKTI